jgi:hypothetical protein
MLGLSLLDEADHRVQEEDGGDRASVDVFAEEGGDDPGREEDGNQGALELVEQDDEVAGRWGLPERVRPEARQALGRLGAREAALARCQERRDLVVREGVLGPAVFDRFYFGRHEHVLAPASDRSCQEWAVAVERPDRQVTGFAE